MRLDQGPTASFKDFAGQMMGRLMQYYLQQKGTHIVNINSDIGATPGVPLLMRFTI
jgi:threonine synthase